MDSIYFTDPLGQLIELASYRFEPPAGFTPRRSAARGAPDQGRERRLQHRAGAPGRRDRAARREVARVAVGGPRAPGSLREVASGRGLGDRAGRGKLTWSRRLPAPTTRSRVHAFAAASASR